MANKRFIVGSSSSWQLKKENAHKKRKLGRGLEGKNDSHSNRGHQDTFAPHVADQ